MSEAEVIQNPTEPVAPVEEKPEEKIIEKPEKVAEQPEEVTEQPEEKATEQPEEKTTEESEKKAAEQSEEKAAEQPEEKVTEQSEEKATEKPEEKATEQPEEKATEQPEAPEDKKTEEAEKKNDANIPKTTAKVDRDNATNNRKFDPSVRKVTDDPEEIRKQVEFYFGDWNFPQDKFMWETCGGSENKPMPIEKIHSFKRMRCFQPYSAVVAAIRESKILEVVGEEGKEAVKRKVPYKPMPAGKAKAEAATVYVKGFGDEQADTQFELETFFAQFGEVNGLKLRRTNDNSFKSSVFVTFADEETAKKFIALDPAPKWKDQDLKIMSKRDYCEEKSELIKQGKLVPNGTSQRKFYEGRDFGRRATRSGASGNQDDWKKRRDQDQRGGFRGGRGGGRGGRGRGGRGGRGRGGRDRDSGRQEKRVDAAATNLKRPREDDAAAAPAAKKVDTKDQ